MYYGMSVKIGTLWEINRAKRSCNVYHHYKEVDIYQLWRWYWCKIIQFNKRRWADWSKIFQIKSECSGLQLQKLSQSILQKSFFPPPSIFGNVKVNPSIWNISECPTYLQSCSYNFCQYMTWPWALDHLIKQ